ncbi:MAG: hypothetical protein V1821_00230, partial [bacterium]
TASGVNHFAALLPSSSPVLFLSGSADADHRAWRERRQRGRIGISDLDYVDHCEYWGARTAELFNLSEVSPWPFDWGIIWSGSGKTVTDTSFFFDAMQDKLFETSVKSKEFVMSLNSPVLNQIVPSFYKFTEASSRRDLWFQYLAPLNILGFDLVFLLKKSLEGYFPHSTMLELFDLMSRMQATFQSLTFHSADSLAPRLNQMLKNFVEEKIGLGQIGSKITSASGRSSVMFAVPTNSFQPWLSEALEYLKSQVSSKLSLEYASWIDGYPKETGLKVEQCFGSGVYSSFVRPDSLVLRIWNIDGSTEEKVIQNQNEINPAEFDLVADFSSGSILVRGYRPGSKELPSVKASLEILNCLFKNIGTPVGNGALPHTIYSQYRNELQGKIISPLNKLFEQRVQKPLGLKTHGGLTDFVLEFRPAGLKLATISNLR